MFLNGEIWEVKLLLFSQALNFLLKNPIYII